MHLVFDRSKCIKIPEKLYGISGSRRLHNPDIFKILKERIATNKSREHFNSVAQNR